MTTTTVKMDKEVQAGNIISCLYKNKHNSEV